MEPSLALYRRYRPETFAEVIGQDHVTEPLRAALANNRVHHAYLFSGPRGCGKTTSARILARTLNCEKAPVADPCGECQSCRDLARDGSGSVDVIEIDAASHGGVDDARDLRERAFFAPVEQPVQGLHHRRGPHGQLAGLQRPAQAGRGAAGAPQVHLRHDRAGEGHPDHPLTHPPLPVPADRAAHAVRPPRRAVREGGRADRRGSAAPRRTSGRRLGPRLPLGARPAARWGRPRRSDVRRRHQPSRLHPRQPARRGHRRVRRRRRGGSLRRRRQGDRDRSGPAPVHRGRPAPAA